MKTACIYHSIDLDGWMSAAIVKYWFVKSNNPREINGHISFENHVSIADCDTSIDFIGYNYGQPIPDLSSYDRVIMCDISFSKEEMEKIACKLIWIDHHISAIKTMDESEYFNSNVIHRLTQTNFAACELTWYILISDEKIPELVNLLGLYDSFRHKGTDKETEVIEFQYGARQCISNYEEAYEYLIMSIENVPYEPRIEENILICGKGIYSYLCTEAKQAYKSGFELIIDIPNFKEPTGVCGNLIIPNKYRFICINKERFNPINFGIDYHKDGYDGCASFSFDGTKWVFSLYNENGKVDCSKLAQHFGGGGHKGAAGFRTEDINKFLNI